jgi:uncharacterized protein (DUF2164 family)
MTRPAQEKVTKHSVTYCQKAEWLVKDFDKDFFAEFFCKMLSDYFYMLLGDGGNPSP